MTQNKKRGIVIGVVCGCLILLVIVLSRFIAVSTEGVFTAAGGCVAVVFDKAPVMGADKILVYEDDEVITIADQALVREVASNFVVANRTALCESRSGDKLEIYNGDVLVRTAYWSDCTDNFAHIYEKDAAHWIWPEGEIGQVELPREVYERIMQIIEGHRNKGA